MPEPPPGSAGAAAPSAKWLSEGGTVPTTFTFAVAEEKVVRTGRPPGSLGKAKLNEGAQARHERQSRQLAELVGSGTASRVPSPNLEEAAGRAGDAHAPLDSRQLCTQEEMARDGLRDKAATRAADKATVGNPSVASFKLIGNKRPVPGNTSQGEEVATLRARVEDLETRVKSCQSTAAAQTKQLLEAQSEVTNAQLFSKDLMKRMDDQDRMIRRLREERNDAKKREKQAVEDGRAALDEMRTTLEAQVTEARDIARALNTALNATRLQMQVACMPVAMPPQAMHQFVAVLPGGVPTQQPAAPAGWGQGVAPQTRTLR